MRRTELLQGLRLMKFEEIYDRTFRRWRDRYEADGAEGPYDRRLSAVSARRAPVDEVAQKGLLDNVTVMVGGAPVTQGFADKVGADIYAPDGSSAAREAKQAIAA